MSMIELEPLGPCGLCASPGVRADGYRCTNPDCLLDARPVTRRLWQAISKVGFESRRWEAEWLVERDRADAEHERGVRNRRESRLERVRLEAELEDLQSDLRELYDQLQHEPHSNLRDEVLESVRMMLAEEDR